MMRTLMIVLAALLLAGAVAGGLSSRTNRSSSAVSAAGAVVAERQSGGGPKVDSRTKEHLGSFEVGRSRKIHLSIADTVDGMGCLIEEEAGAESSSCLEGGLFAARKAELIVRSEGGPERLEELHLVGVVAPNVRGVSVVKTDGTAVPIAINPTRAFVFESTAADLEARVYPTALRLYGPSGKLVDTLDFPAAG